MPSRRAAFLRPRFSLENPSLQEFQFKNLPPPAKSRWDRADYYANKKKFEGPVHAAPWRGFVAEYRRRGDPASKSRKKNELLWAEQVMDGLRTDQLALVEEGYRYRLSDPDCRVTGGTCGAPYHYGRASFFTQEQVDKLTGHKKQELERFASDRRMFLGRNEWREVLEPLPLVATYMQPAPWVEKARRGDSGLSLAIRCLRFDAALLMVQQVGMDVLTGNCEGESAADLLAEQLARVDEELGEIEQLKYRRQSNILRYGITEEQEARLKLQPLWELKRMQANRLAAALAGKAQAYLDGPIAGLRYKASRCLIEGFSLTPEEEAVLAREPFVLAYLQSARRTYAATDDSPLPEAYDPEVQERKRRDAAMTRLQAWWRGTSCRRGMWRRRVMLAAYRLQLLFKLLVARRRFLRRRQQEAEEAEERQGGGWDLKRPDLTVGIMSLLEATGGTTGAMEGASSSRTTTRRSSSSTAVDRQARESLSQRSQSAAATVRGLLARSRRSSDGLASTTGEGALEEGADSSIRARRMAFRSSSAKSFGQSLGRLASGLASAVGVGGAMGGRASGGAVARPGTPTPLLEEQ